MRKFWQITFVTFFVFAVGATTIGTYAQNPGVFPIGNITPGHCVSWASPFGIQDNGGTCAAAAPVQSVFGRTGAVAAASGDYSSAQISGLNTVNGAIKGNGAGALSQAACADLTNGSASCSTDTTNAGNISSGTLNLARLSLAQNHMYVGNAGGNPADNAPSSAFDNMFCNTVGWFVARTTGGWICAQGIPANVEWFNILPGNTPATNSTNLANLLATIGSGQLMFPHDGYSFNTMAVISARQNIYCAYRADPTISGNIIQVTTNSNMFAMRGSFASIRQCSVSMAGNPTGGQGVVLGDDTLTVANGASMSGTTTLTCLTCTFTSGDVGKQFGVPGGGTVGFFSAFTDANHRVATVSATFTNQTITYGFDYEEDEIVDSFIYNYTVAINVQAAVQFHFRHVWVWAAQPIFVTNTIWADQGDGTIAESQIYGSVAGAFSAMDYRSGGGLRFINNKILSAAISNCFQVLWQASISSVGPWIIGNSIEGGCSSGITVNGSSTGVAHGGVIEANEIGIASAGTAINLTPTTTHPHWTVLGNLIRQTGGGSAVTVSNMSNILLGPNNGQNEDANGGGIFYGLGTTPTGSVYVNQTDIANPIQCNSGCTSMVVDDPAGLAFASLFAAANGSRIFVTNGTPASSPCTGGSTGSAAFRQNGAWKCF